MRMRRKGKNQIQNLPGGSMPERIADHLERSHVIALVVYVDVNDQFHVEGVMLETHEARVEFAEGLRDVVNDWAGQIINQGVN